MLYKVKMTTKWVLGSAVVAAGAAFGLYLARKSIPWAKFQRKIPTPEQSKDQSESLSKAEILENKEPSKNNLESLNEDEFLENEGNVSRNVVFAITAQNRMSGNKKLFLCNGRLGLEKETQKIFEHKKKQLEDNGFTEVTFVDSFGVGVTRQKTLEYLREQNHSLIKETLSQTIF
jgi:hypothetical protein